MDVLLRKAAFALLVVLVGGLAACTAPDEKPRPTGTTSAAPVLRDQGLRPVRMSSGRALTYVQPDTASQVLCQVLDQAGWEQLLGGAIGRKPLPLPYAGCQVSSEHGVVRLQLREFEDAFEPATTVAGRPARTYDRTGGRAVYVLALTDDALRAVSGGSLRTLRTLEVETTGDDPKEGISLRVLDEVVPLLTKETEPLPAIDDNGGIAYAMTPLTGGDQFIDLPRPVQALQLCTVLLEGIAATDVDVADTGTCTLTTARGRLTAETMSTQRRTYSDRVAGRPAELQDSPPRVTVSLRNDADVALAVSGPDAVALAEKLVPLLVG